MRNPKNPELPTRRPPILKKGETYKFTPLNLSGSAKKSKNFRENGEVHDSQFKATVEKVYKEFYLLRTPAGYHTTMMRNALGIDWGITKV